MTDAHQICRLAPGFPQDFPRAPTNAHQMMQTPRKVPCGFACGLYNNFGYTAQLAPLTPPLQALLGAAPPCRVLIEYETTGICEASAW